MRSVGTGVVLLALVGLAGCDTEQPLRVQSQTVAIDFFGASGTIRNVDAYDMTEDGNPGAQWLWCEDLGAGRTTFVPDLIPWNFALRVTILRAGTVTRENLTDSGSLNPVNNISQYDTRAPFLGQTPAAPAHIGATSITVGTRTFRFANPRQLTGARREVVAATSNPLSDMDPGTYGLGSGLCSTFDPGPASVDGVVLPFTIDDFGSGDTLFVEVSRSGTPPQGIVVTSQPTLSAAVFVDGRRTENLNGTTSVPATAGATFAFSFTSR
ncbi:MAG TPA: hypothetical protein VJS92_08620 [Candidatus Polarisedimenticolaceae bacterium]|nr:hypothetical protein [Candidatus Polarisedimenticolaceae bacterium]